MVLVLKVSIKPVDLALLINYFLVCQVKLLLSVNDKLLVLLFQLCHRFKFCAETCDLIFIVVAHVLDFIAVVILCFLVLELVVIDKLFDLLGLLRDDLLEKLVMVLFD